MQDNFRRGRRHSPRRKMDMKFTKAVAFLFVVMLLSDARAQAAEPKTFTDAECAAIQKFVDACVAGGKSAIVVGLVDEDRKNILAAGTLDNGTGRAVDGDSVFFIGSVSKTFTA